MQQVSSEKGPNKQIENDFQCLPRIYPFLSFSILCKSQGHNAWSLQIIITTNHNANGGKCFKIPMKIR